MMAVGGRSRIRREERSCRICGGPDLETAEHFLCQCPEYTREREECVRRLRIAVAAYTTPQLSQALDSVAVELFLGDSLVRHLPADSAWRADAIVCDFLMLAWRKRSAVWKTMTVDGNEWLVRV